MAQGKTLSGYRRYVIKRLKRLQPVFARAAVGDFSRNIKIPDEEDEFLDLFVGAQIMLEVIRVQLADLKATNEDLKRLNQIRTEFTSIVSHELRTPLNAIREGVSLVVEGIDGPVNKAQSETLEIVRRNVDRLARLISNVLDFARLDTGKMKMIFRETDLHALLKEVARFLRPAADKKSISLTLTLPKANFRAFCDPDRIKEVVINLVDNAMKFSRDGGRITIILQRSGQEARIDVTDSGPGIPKQDQKKIFEIFEQGSVGRILGSGGAGIGLAVCKLILDQHHGRISLKRSSRRGARFTVVWPLNQPHTP
jgi:signal transduction histidine kinase